MENSYSKFCAHFGRLDYYFQIGSVEKEKAAFVTLEPYKQDRTNLLHLYSL